VRNLIREISTIFSDVSEQVTENSAQKELHTEDIYTYCSTSSIITVLKFGGK